MHVGVQTVVNTGKLLATVLCTELLQQSDKNMQMCIPTIQ